MITTTPKKRARFKTILLSLLSFGLLSFASSCTASNQIVGIHMSSEETVKVPYGNFSPDGISVTVDYRDGGSNEIPLTNEMISETEHLKFFKVGEQDVEVVYRNRYKTTMPVEVTLNEFSDSYALVGGEYIFDGEPHMVSLNQELPEGARITYPYGNVFTNAGVYEVVGVMSKNGYASKTLTTTLTIYPAARPVEGIVLMDATYVYNGEMRSLEIENVPEGVEVSFDAYDYNTNVRVNKVVNAGKYKIVAHFNDVNPNYAKIEDMSATLTILKADYDLSNIALLDVTKEYDGKHYDASITNPKSLPTGIEVSYSYLDQDGNTVFRNAACGTYTMVASFKGGDSKNYNSIEPLTATLTVKQKVIKIKELVAKGDIAFEGKTVNFEEGVTQSLSITGDLPAGVSVTYENNNQYCAGEYEVTAHFAATDSNFAVDLSEMKAYLVINQIRRSVLVYDELTGKYTKPFGAKNLDFEGNTVKVNGIDEDVYEVTSIAFFDVLDNSEVPYEEIQNEVTYTYVVRFAYKDPDLAGSIILADESDNFLRRSAPLVYDSNTGDYTKEFSSDNLVLNSQEASVTGVDTTLYKVSEIVFYDQEGNETKVGDLKDKTTYRYAVHFDLKDKAAARSTVLIDATGEFVARRVLMRDENMKYTLPFSAQDICIRSDSLIPTYRAELIGRYDYEAYSFPSGSLTFFNTSGTQINANNLSEVDEMVDGETYIYKAAFRFKSSAPEGHVLVQEQGTFTREKVEYETLSFAMDGSTLKVHGFDETKYVARNILFYRSPIVPPYTSTSFNNLEVGHSYIYRVDFIFADREAGKSIALASAVEEFVFEG